MASRLIVNDRVDFPDGTIRQMVIWEVSPPVPGSMHSYKYRLYFGAGGKRLIGYDNERGKGDHRHAGESEEQYPFKGLERLVIDFWDDIDQWRSSAGQDPDDFR
jgi:hypothetical protein